VNMNVKQTLMNTLATVLTHEFIEQDVSIWLRCALLKTTPDWILI